jgi:tryptophan synthase alpha chain
MADGPVILRANQKALENGSTVKQCLAFARTVAQDFSIPFLFMSYANILFKYGMDPFADTMARINLKGAIVPDLPPEEGADYIQAMKRNTLAPIFIFSPETSDARLSYLSSAASGFVYCLARKGVTGKETDFSHLLDTYLARCRKATHLPLAVGFGVKKKDDVDHLKGRADIAVIGSETIRIIDEKGVAAAGEFIRTLR